MRISMFEVPEDSASWPKWLEQQIAGLDLGDLVAELKAVANNDQPKKSLEDVCGDSLPRIESEGLRVLATSQISQLFSQPELLFELQERVLTSCEPYWNSVALPAEQRAKVDASIAQSKAAIKHFLSTQKAGGDIFVRSTSTEGKLPQAEVLAPKASLFSSRRAWTMIALAAGILLAVFLFSPTNSADSQWGFEKDGLFAAKLSAPKYLKSLSDAAGDWTKQRPDSKQPLVARLKDYSRGCAKLIDAPNTQLTTVDRKWLVEKCTKWKGDIDQLIKDLENNVKSFSTGLEEADRIADRMKIVLRDKAIELA